MKKFSHIISQWVWSLLKDVFKTYFQLIKIMIPILIATKILVSLGAIDMIGKALSPLMQLVGLPGSTGLVWAACMLVNIYAGIFILATIAISTPLTVAQVTVLSLMILVAHSMPMELRISQKVGTRLVVMLFLRLFCAFLFGWLLYRFYNLTGLFQTPNHLIWNPAPADSSLWAWVLSQLQSLLTMFFIILGLMALLRILTMLKVTDFLCRLLKPGLTVLGMSEKAAPLTLLGIIMGIVIGSGLILQEARSGKLEMRETFYSMALMSLCHSLIEDTLLVLMIGANVSGILVARLLFCIPMIFLIVRLTKSMSDEKFSQFFMSIPLATPVSANV